MQEEIRVGKGELDFAGLHGELGGVVLHLLDKGADADGGELRGIREDAGFLSLHGFLLGDLVVGRGGGFPELFHGSGGHAGVGYRRFQQGLEQVFVFRIVLLMHPEGFHQVMGVLGFLGIELLGPFAEGATTSLVSRSLSSMRAR